MAKTDLGGLLNNVGAPFLKKIVEGSLPAPWNSVGGAAIDILAERLGASEASPDAIVARYEADPKTAGSIIQELEASPGDILASIEQQKHTNALLLAEMKEPLWTWAWRPLAMYGIGVLWFWNLIVLHLLNWFWKSQLPQADLWVLFQLNLAYMALYMGGHTLKDFISKKWGAA